MSLRNWVALAAIAAGAVGLGLDFYVISGVPRPFADMLIYYLTFFTHVTNIWLLAVYLAELSGWRVLAGLLRPVARASIAGLITLVMLFYHFMLAPHYHFTGPVLYANYLLHYVSPILYLISWFGFSRHGALKFRDVPFMLLPGVIYVAWVLLRGGVTGEYPYDILDAGQHGYGAVAIGTAILIALVGVFDMLLVFVDGLLGRRARSA